MLKVGVIGATGYTGEELVKILASHKGIQVTSLTAKIDKAEKIQSIFPSLEGKIDMMCELPDEDMVAKASDFVFLALPHKISMEAAPRLLKAKKKVVDLSADYRLPADIYTKWYGAAHKDVDGLKHAVYGLPELNREKIKTASLIANPGCYPTSIILGLAPLFKEKIADPSLVIADSKSGVTGAGRRADMALSFGEVNESLKAYKINEHQHSPEISQELSKLAGSEVGLVFVPHLIPMNRGILSTIYIKLKRGIDTKEAVGLYKNFYKSEPFVKVLAEGQLPQIKDVRTTNFCYIGIKVDTEKGLAIIVSAIDNLTKGAAGQAVQNMNIMCGFKETEGLL
ncbi:MAG: N-acetyl-gamma-glutamyl-phosphate reductase [Candidatus Omnitrophica bacterium]|nr:N-acetyl-gamma-glutamyl-phosphate reductase [Candidatus Omnitrophota bacterium]